MSEHSATQTRQTAAPEAGSKNELRLQRKCACGQHTPGGGECRDCNKKRVTLQRWSTDGPAPETLLARARPTLEVLHSDGAPRGLDFSRIGVRAGPAAAQLPADALWLRKPSAPGAPGGRRLAMPSNRTAGLMPDDGRSSRFLSAEPLVVPVAAPGAYDSGNATQEPAEPVSGGGRASAAPDSAGAPADAPASAAAPAPAPASMASPARPAGHPAPAAGAADKRPQLESWEEAREEDAEEPAQAAAQRSFLYDDGRADPAPTQMSKHLFLARLRSAVTQAAEEALADTGRTTDGCPYLRFWFDYYSRKSSRHIERALRRYAPEVTRATRASDYIPIVVERVRRAVTTWAETGEITGVPRDLPARPPDGRRFSHPKVSMRTSRVFGPVFFKARDGGAHAADDPEAIQATLGDGRPLDAGVRARMEAAFGRGVGPVHLHTGATPNRLAGELNARAFTIGNHVAFGAGQYRPGTPVGDALIAHEMAHVVQQQSAARTVAPMTAGRAPYDALEADADEAAAGIVTSLWGRAERAGGAVRDAVPSLRSGLRLQRCGTFSEWSSEKYQGYDSSTSPEGLVVPVGGDRNVKVRNKEDLTLTSDKPSIATVDDTKPGDGMTVTGVSHGDTFIEARKGKELEERLDVSSKDRKDFTVDYHYMSDNARHTTRRKQGDERRMTDNLNRIWERQANVRFTTGTVDAKQVQQDLGDGIAVKNTTSPEWRAITAFATGGDYNVFLVWEFDVSAVRGDFADVDAGTAGGNTIMEDDTCNEELVLPHEAGHFMGLSPKNQHPSSGIMAVCNSMSPRVYKKDADQVNP